MAAALQRLERAQIQILQSRKSSNSSNEFMSGDISEKFLKLAVEENLITREQLNECLELQKTTGKPLAYIMLQKGYITDEMISRIMYIDSRSSSLEKGEDREVDRDAIFKKIALLKGYVTKEQLSDCVQTQKRFQSARYSIPLKSLVVKKGYMNHDRVLEVLELAKRVLYCPFCDKQYIPQKQVAHGKLRRCTNCGGTLTPAFPEEYRRGAEEDMRKKKRDEISRRISRGNS